MSLRLNPQPGLQISVYPLSLPALCADWEADLRKLSLMCAGLGGAAALVLTLTAPANAKSCSERIRTCQGFCAKTEGGFARVPSQMR